jgi:predicted Rossmann-fold nucleotide-binding protein
MRSVRTFAERKAGLLRGVTAAVVFPGGIGTLDELGDLLCLNQTGFLKVPVILVDLKGYYRGLRSWLSRATRDGFLYGSTRLEVVTGVKAALSSLSRNL